MYYMSKEELEVLSQQAGFETKYVKYACVQNENRKTGVKLKRVFLQGVFKKPDE